MLISGDDRMSRISSCLRSAHHFLLTDEEARAIVAHQITTIGESWSTVCDEAALTETDRTLLSTRQFLNPFAFDDLHRSAAGLGKLAEDVRAHWRS